MQDHIPANISEGMVPFLYIVGQILDYYKDLSGREWADTVKGHICIEDNTKPGPPLHAEDIIQDLLQVITIVFIIVVIQFNQKNCKLLQEPLMVSPMKIRAIAL
ncbi:unnamed protein product [Rhizophagus irregularis]|nr:unnamed protein product [Rhizophagus irregularis]